jgi:AIR synthase-related protein
VGFLDAERLTSHQPEPKHRVIPKGTPPLRDMSLNALAAALLRGRGLAHKRDISAVMGLLSQALPGPASAAAESIAVGDDCAAIPDGDGYLLFAIEGFVEDLVARMPWFAGYCGVMVNVSDIYAMGGRPMVVVDALWSRDHASAQPLLEGLAAASIRYGVPIVGGHTNSQNSNGQLAVAIIGRARRLLTSFDARAGDCLVMAIDLRGAYEEPHPYWNASTSAPAERLRADLEVLPALAEGGLCDAAKDISMAGAIGTTLMLLECSKVGARIDIDAIPRPESVVTDAAVLRWLQAFPSYGFVLSVRPDQVDAVQLRFRARGIACAVVGQVTPEPQVTLHRDGDTALLWNMATQPLILPRAQHHATLEDPNG